jgi:hypothetical protein
MQPAKALEEDRFLEKLVGVWNVTSDDMGGGQQWTEIVRSLHGTWVVAEGNGQMPDGSGAATTVLTLGYSPSKGRYIGTWIGSMMDHMWIYDGEVSPDGRVLSLHTRGPDCQGGSGEQDYREQIAFIDDDNRTFTSFVKQADGSWHRLMEARYARKP